MFAPEHNKGLFFLFVALVWLPVVFGWYAIFTQSQSLEAATITTYQNAQIEVARSSARGANEYIRSEIRRRGETAIPAIEQEVLRLFVQPIHVGTIGDAWIYAPDHVVFNEREDFPSEYMGKSMAEIFAIQQQHGAEHYVEMTTAVMKGQEGTGWYIWDPDKARESTPWWELLTQDAGREIAAWSPVVVFPDTDHEKIWIIGISAMLPELMHSNGAYAQIHWSIMAMSCMTVAVLVLFVMLHRTAWALRKSDARYRTIIEDQTEFIVRFRPNGTLVFANAAYANYLDTTPESLVGRNFFTLTPTVDSLDHASQLALLNQEHPVDTCEYQVVMPDGKLCWQQWTNRAVLDTHGHIIEIQSVGRDITEHKQADAALLQAEQRYRTLFEDAPLMYVITRRQDDIAIIVDCNDLFLRTLDYTRIEVIGEPLDRFYSDSSRVNLLSGGFLRALAGEFQEEERVLVTRDGRSIHTILRALPEFDSHGQAIGTRAIYMDITERKQIEHELRESESRFRLIAEHIDEVFWLATPDHSQILYVSPAYETLFGQDCASLYANPDAFFTVIHPRDQARIRQTINQLDTGIFDLEYQIIRPDETMRWVWSRGRAIYDDQHKIVRKVGVVKDITHRKHYEAQIEHLAFTDALTNLPNRRYIYDLGDVALAEQSNGTQCTTLLYLDLNRFKAVNDTLGHDVGDTLLVQVATRLRACIRDGDTLARLGGDEFAVLLPHSNITQAQVVAERILQEMTQPFELHGHLVHLGGSIGIATHSSEAMPFSALLTQADIAMYWAKAMGGGIQVYDPNITSSLPDYLQMETDLRRALNSDGLILHYQPILCLSTHEVIGVEALVRWAHPTRGWLTPNIFLPLAEEIGLLEKLDRWVLQTALEQAAAWIAAEQSFFVSINLTAQSLQRPDFVTDLNTLLMTMNVPAAHVMIELTESTALRDLTTTQQVLASLKELGVRIALDDFGTGYASLTHLRQLPVDVLKLDRSFASGIGRDSRDEAVIRALLALGEGLHVDVIAEGVEEAAHLDWLQQEGCSLAQGYFMGPPMSKEAIESVQGQRRLPDEAIPH